MQHTLSIGLMVTPGGNGFEVIEVPDTYTVGDLVAERALFGRTITVDNQELTPDKFSSTSLRGVREVWATGGAKGA